MGVEVCVSSIFNFQLSTLKAVSETEARHDVLAVRPDLLAQAGDVDVDRTVEHIYFVFPYPGKDFFAREHVPFVFEEEFQYLEFLFGERTSRPSTEALMRRVSSERVSYLRHSLSCTFSLSDVRRSTAFTRATTWRMEKGLDI